MTNQETEPFWKHPQVIADTVAYNPPATPPTPRTWRTDGEHILNRLDDTYMALTDLMPAIAAVTTLIALVAATPQH